MSNIFEIHWIPLILACIASISVGLGSKERPKERNRNEIGARARIRKRGWGRGRKETLANKPLDFENLRSPANGGREWLDQSNVIGMCRS